MITFFVAASLSIYKMVLNFFTALAMMTMWACMHKDVAPASPCFLWGSSACYITTAWHILLKYMNFYCMPSNYPSGLLVQLWSISRQAIYNILPCLLLLKVMDSATPHFTDYCNRNSLRLYTHYKQIPETGAWNHSSSSLSQNLLLSK